MHQDDDEESGNGLLRLVRNDMRDMKAAMGQMAEAITHLAVLEEKHFSLRKEVEKIAGRVDEIAETVTEIRVLNANIAGNAQGVSWVMKSIWAVVGGLVGTAGFFLLQLLLPPAAKL